MYSPVSWGCLDTMDNPPVLDCLVCDLQSPTEGVEGAGEGEEEPGAHDVVARVSGQLDEEDAGLGPHQLGVLVLVLPVLVRRA